MILSVDGHSLLLRGGDLVSYAVTGAPQGYSISYNAASNTLGTRGPITGRGAMAFSPVDSTRAVAVQGPGASDVNLITGLPGAITLSSHTTLTPAATALSVALTPAGNFAVVGTDVGVFVVGGVATSALAQVNPAGGAFSPSYTDSFGATRKLANATSIGVSGDGKFVAALVAETSGTALRASLVVLPLDVNGNLANPAVVVNNVPPPAGDNLVVR
jgi:hypothetical protein